MRKEGTIVIPVAKAFRKKTLMELDYSNEIVIEIPVPDDAESAASSKASSNIQKIRSSVSKRKHKKISILKQILDRLMRQMQWVKLHLGHHVVNQRSIHFVLDTYFEHYKQHQLCK